MWHLHFRQLPVQTRKICLQWARSDTNKDLHLWRLNLTRLATSGHEAIMKLTMSEWPNLMRMETKYSTLLARQAEASSPTRRARANTRIKVRASFIRQRGSRPPHNHSTRRLWCRWWEISRIIIKTRASWMLLNRMQWWLEMLQILCLSSPKCAKLTCLTKVPRKRITTPSGRRMRITYRSTHSEVLQGNSIKSTI